MAGIDGLVGALTTQLIEALVRAKTAEDKADAAIKMASDCMKEVLELKAQSYDPFGATSGPAGDEDAPKKAQKLSPFALGPKVGEVGKTPKVEEMSRSIDDPALVDSQIWDEAISDV